MICRPQRSCRLISFSRHGSSSVLDQSAATLLPLNRQIRKALNANGNDAAWFDPNLNRDSEVLIPQFAHMSHKKNACVVLLSCKDAICYIRTHYGITSRLINCGPYQVGGHCSQSLTNLLLNLPYLFNGLIEVNVLCTTLVRPFSLIEYRLINLAGVVVIFRPNFMSPKLWSIYNQF